MTTFVQDNQLTLLRNGTEYFPALESAIENAHTEIHVQSYIFTDDSTGQRIAAALKRAAGRDVLVCVLVDGVGSIATPAAFFEDLRLSGVWLLIYRPAHLFWRFKRHNLHRLHRKLAVIDGEVGFVGGINIIDDMNTPGSTPPRIDYAVMVQGPLLQAMTDSAQSLWRRMAWRRWHNNLITTFPKPQPIGTTKAAYVVRDNTLHRRDIESAYLDAIKNARHEIIIAHAYFLPGMRFRRALANAARRGVKVALILQQRVEFWLLDQATQALYGNFLDAGVNIHQYRPSMMHCKVAVIDQRWATVGSSNLDPISLLLAREANVIVDDKQFAAQLRNDLLQTISVNTQQVTASSWQHKTPLQRAVAWMGYGLVRLIIGLTGSNDVKGGQ